MEGEIGCNFHLRNELTLVLSLIDGGMNLNLPLVIENLLIEDL